jgi:hypothetical protein
MSAKRLKQFLLPPVLALLLSAAHAQNLSFSLTPAAQSGVGTGEVYFTGALTNTGLATNFLNNIQIAFTGAATNYFTADTNVFFANVPGIFLPGDAYTDVVFGVVINPATPPGNYSGTVTIQGGTDIFGAGNLTNQTFQILLPPAALSISASGGNIIFSWPSPPGSFVLQQISDLTTTNWTAVTNTVATTNYLNQVMFPPAAASQFYRLEYP